MIPNFNIEQHSNELRAIQDEIAILKKREASLKSDITQHYDELIAKDLASKDEPFGKVRIKDGGYELHYTVPKKVIWDQEKLSALREKMSADERGLYITTKHAVAEASYKAWPKEIQDLFTDARTTKPGSSSFTIINLDEA